ncbi:hypothetical protein KKF91_13415 [Myxococcota bacterium]|nr:hypothetical protein [Myxococcota bacterium]MBU1431535.1 hypothetical protein [Myxococcota bacterium]MBU1899632.1 hypothetical protein [Myxococcota bacterium]
MSRLYGEITEDEIKDLIQRRGVTGVRELIEPLTDHLALNWNSQPDLIFTREAEERAFKALLDWVERGAMSVEAPDALPLTLGTAKRKLKHLSVRRLDPALPGVIGHLAVRLFGEGAVDLLEELFFRQPRQDTQGDDLGYNTHGVVEAISMFVATYPHRVHQFTQPAAAAIARGVGFERDCEALLQALPDPDEEDEDGLDESLVWCSEEER